MPTKRRTTSTKKAASAPQAEIQAAPVADVETPAMPPEPAPVYTPPPPVAAAPKPAPTPDYNAMPEMLRLGDILKRVREQRGERLDYVSDYLRIRPAFLEALEDSHYEQLPADAYVIGFLRSYANYLGLDGKGAIDQYRREMAGRRRKPALSMPQPISEGRAPSAIVIGGAIVAALLVYAMWYGFSSSDRRVVDTPPVITANDAAASAEANQTPVAPTTDATPAQTTISAAPVVSAPAAAPVIAQAPVQTPVAPVPAAQAPAVQAPLPIAPQAPVKSTSGAGTVIIEIDDDSWIQITDSRGNVLFDRLMKAGESYKVPNQKGLYMTTGNAGGVILNLDGVDLPKIGNDEQVIHDIALSADSLQTLLPHGGKTGQ